MPTLRPLTPGKTQDSSLRWTRAGIGGTIVPPDVKSPDSGRGLAVPSPDVYYKDC
jgi:hypothetical protein